MKYILLLCFALTLENAFAQDPSTDRWYDSGEATVIEPPATISGSVIIKKGNIFSSTFNELLRIQTTDSPSDFMSFRNATTRYGSMVPAIFSYNETGSGSSLMLIGVTNYSNDYGESAIMRFDARKYFNNSLSGGDGAITGRPLFSWANFTTIHMQMLANGNLGLGTISPQAQLHTTGTVRLGGLPSGASSFAVMSDNNGNLTRYQLPTNTTLATFNGLSVGTNTIPKFNAAGTLLNSQLTDDGDGLGIGGSPVSGAKLALYGTLRMMSDERTKTNIVRMTNALQKVEVLNGYYYDWKTGGAARETGFLAQEVESVLPEAVSQNAEGTKFLNYNGVIPLLTEAIKEQQQLILEQSALIKQLRREVDALKAK
ncbi:tail fiber domain-containing protein [Rudanella paleaurantiibacter]|uniref:Tail fiber domain-containing protein n=1 Tax=Rudanella paleaurantiibacter TaxID=2614655 RepID=A0A7J5U5G5_9BACT|nr:tail fiber domain-containing protein [Rudanella paleaurantiibacter]KAB7732325.1 tail fiber domain-containing protein [Rudanella paleaurantiibacter]